MLACTLLHHELYNGGDIYLGQMDFQFCYNTTAFLSLSTIVLNSRDQHKNMVSHFFTSPQQASQYTIPKKTDWNTLVTL